MTPEQFRDRRLAAKVSLLRLAAHTGLPSSYIEQIETGDVVALESDLARLARAVEEIVAQRKARR